MALIQLEGVWQNRLATFRVHNNINIRNELRWAELVNSQNFKKKYCGLIFKPLGNYLVKLFYSNVMLDICYSVYVQLLFVSLWVWWQTATETCQWIKHLCPLTSTVLLSLRLHFPHPNWYVQQVQYVFSIQIFNWALPSSPFKVLPTPDKGYQQTNLSSLYICHHSVA